MEIADSLKETVTLAGVKIPVPALAVGAGIVIFLVVRLRGSAGPEAVLPVEEGELEFVESPQSLIEKAAGGLRGEFQVGLGELGKELGESFKEQIRESQAAFSGQVTGLRGDLQATTERFAREQQAIRQEQAQALSQFRGSLPGTIAAQIQPLEQRVTAVERQAAVNRGLLTVLSQWAASTWQIFAPLSPEAAQTYQRMGAAYYTAASLYPPTPVQQSIIDQLLTKWRQTWQG